MAPSRSTPMRISLVYTIYFLWVEPLFALAGTYLCLFDPARFLTGTVPVPGLSIETKIISPVSHLILTNIGSLYVLFAIVEGITLRVTKEREVWFTILGALLISDVGHLYAAYSIAPSHASDFMSWNSDEWINYGTLTLGFLLRLAFMLGLGRNRIDAKDKSRTFHLGVESIALD
ncbi:hypothetical protein G7Y89_g3860 [Cudoniella acicularis]|uniref:DUF7704 domain-containing protein n=1 Tax=Cudoniella acicularis TaxID=354080 RepID=A0A8H4RRT1_9HELO|nr:hypothetical protein G7Y89_g3860 [Cudoniella acicularis]